jgi:hypothetical protein
LRRLHLLPDRSGRDVQLVRRELMLRWRAAASNARKGSMAAADRSWPGDYAIAGPQSCNRFSVAEPALALVGHTVHLQAGRTDVFQEV